MYERVTVIHWETWYCIDLVFPSFISLISYNRICLISHVDTRIPQSGKVSYVRRGSAMAYVSWDYGTGRDRESKG